MKNINIMWNISTICNFNCDHCSYANKITNKNFLNKNQIFKIIKKLNDAQKKIDKDIKVGLIGAEPTQLTFFKKVVKKLYYSNLKIGITSNGGKKGKIIEVLPYIDELTISLDGPTKKYHEITRPKGSFKIVSQNIKEISKKIKSMDKEILFSINCVINNKNYIVIDEMISFAKNLGVDSINLLQNIPIGNAKEKDYELEVKNHLESVKKVAQEYSKKSKSISINARFTRPLAKDYSKKVLGLDFPKHIHGCGAGSYFGLITKEGNLYPCDRFDPNVYKEKYFGEQNYSLLDKKFFEIWNMKLFHHSYTIENKKETFLNYYPCMNCKYLGIDCTPCPAQLIQENKFGHSIICEAFLEKIYEEDKYEEKHCKERRY
ncbi:MAG: radical SAM protein [Candidatus Mcinerneyibacterium aminivorans]|uniref:Radical SAM protein n=1 Tax=Candidatus Mcinerneyibacterium aminivorans TaxID=2703815 RepID=A0A5D0MIB5_9BACT|nr:MAG: radical SAM protein [Candidatus Mcinerneyibacterium aminivorans]